MKTFNRPRLESLLAAGAQRALEGPCHRAHELDFVDMRPTTCRIGVIAPVDSNVVTQLRKAASRYRRRAAGAPTRPISAISWGID
jgi:hypothetical protein